MAHSSLEAAGKEVPITVEWRAFELRPEEERDALDEAAMEEKRRQIEAFWPRVQAIAKERFGLEMERGPWGIDTRLAHIGAKVARAFGKEDAYHRAVFRKYWSEQADISQASTLDDVARAIGLDMERFRSGLQDQAHRAAVLAEELGAHRIGINGVPAIIIDSKYLLSGAQPAEVLIRAIGEYREKGTINGR